MKITVSDLKRRLELMRSKPVDPQLALLEAIRANTEVTARMPVPTPG